ncbi:hypothetical protein BT96DRAFT_828669, partial [Gymnopus androsaceus JB14]
SFYRNLKEHLYCRLMDISESDKLTEEEIGSVSISLDRMYKHKVLRVNYTTYDMHHAQDSINPRTHPHVMVLSDDDDHPYHYACILVIYHAMVSLGNQPPCQMDFLWVCWFGFDSERCWGWKAKRLPRVGFLDSQYAFGFLDPASVI